MHRTRKLCAVIVETLGQECLANSQPRLEPSSTPVYDRKLSAQPRDKVGPPALDTWVCEWREGAVQELGEGCAF